MPSATADQVQPLVLVLIPADPQMHREVAQRQGIPVWSPSTEHSLVSCPRCGKSCWIGPSQRDAWASRSLRAVSMLCVCCLQEEGAGHIINAVHVFNSQEHLIPRRV
jgi:hypothetical protein